MPPERDQIWIVWLWRRMPVTTVLLVGSVATGLFLLGGWLVQQGLAGLLP